MSDKSLPKRVSVIVPVYNRELLIIDSLESILHQSYRPIELVLIDDGSTDKSLSIIKQWSNRLVNEPLFYIKIIEQKNSGAPSARNAGLRNATGEYIQFFDSDDLLLHDKIRLQVEYLEKNTSVDYVYSQAMVFTDCAENTGVLLGSAKSQTLEGHVGSHALKTDLGIYRRAIINKMGDWNVTLKVWQEGEFNLRLFTHKATIAYLPGVLAMYRVHNNGRVSSTLSSYKYIHALKAFEHTGRKGITGRELEVFYKTLVSRYLSIFLHSSMEGMHANARLAAKESFRAALLSNSIMSAIKAFFSTTITFILPPKVRASVTKILYRKLVNES